MKFCLEESPFMNILKFLGVCVMPIIIASLVISLILEQRDVYFWVILTDKRGGKHMILQIEESLFLRMCIFIRQFFHLHKGKPMLRIMQWRIIIQCNGLLIQTKPIITPQHDRPIMASHPIYMWRTPGGS